MMSVRGHSCGLKVTTNSAWSFSLLGMFIIGWLLLVICIAWLICSIAILDGHCGLRNMICRSLSLGSLFLWV